MSDCTALDAREERFCREYVRRPIGKYAAKFAGYDPADIMEAAHQLLARKDIQERIAALRHELAWRQCHDADAVLARLQAVYELALESEQYSTAMRAVALQARIAAQVDERGRGTHRRRERPVTWAWDGKSTAAEQAPMSIDANESKSFETPAGPPHPAPTNLAKDASAYAGASCALPSARTSVLRAATQVSKNTSPPSTQRWVVNSSPG